MDLASDDNSTRSNQVYQAAIAWAGRGFIDNNIRELPQKRNIGIGENNIGVSWIDIRKTSCGFIKSQGSCRRVVDGP